MIKRLDINISISSVPHKHIQTISSTCAPGTNDFVMLMSCLLVANLTRKKDALSSNAKSLGFITTRD